MLLLLQECLEYIEQQYKHMDTLKLITLESQRKYEYLHNKITNHILGLLDPSHRQTNIESIEIELKAPKQNVFRSSTHTSVETIEDEMHTEDVPLLSIGRYHNEENIDKDNTNIHNENEDLLEDTYKKFVDPSSSTISENSSSKTTIMSTKSYNNQLKSKTNSFCKGRSMKFAAFYCEICKRQFVQKSVLKRHMITHTGYKPFACEICKRKFGQKSVLKSHMATHTGEKPFECEICDKKFARQSYLNEHMSIHSYEKSFKCEICQKRFTRKSYLNKHMLAHSTENLFQCEICKKRLSHKSTLKRHMLVHTRE